ncbi:MAG: hypothetical protein WCK32_03110 [Chlorobiaceae bacterium]
MGQKVRYEYKSTDDYKPVYVTGVHGGFNGSNDLIAHFFFEHLPVWKESISELNNDGSVRDITDVNYDDTIQVSRTIQTGIIMNIEAAKVFRKWLDDHISIIEAQKKI